MLLVYTFYVTGGINYFLNYMDLFKNFASPVSLYSIF